MGEVYRATDTRLKRDVAVKVLPAALAGDPDRLARFQREAEVLASLNHPNIGGIHGVEESGGVTALVLELVEGPTLADRIAQGAIPIDEALPIARQIAEAMEAAHEHGIIHRDLKPANIKVRDDGTVKVLDFGLAKAMEPAVSSPTVSQSPTITSPAMTQLGVILGTAAYMAPEQARGKPVDKRADIWAFGCVLYEMLTGRRAFAGDDVSDVLAAVLAREPDWTLLPRGFSPQLVSFEKRCLHKDRKQRVGDAQSLRLALEGAFDTGVAEATQSRAMVQPAWRRALPAAAGLVGVALLIGVTAWMLWPTMEPHAVNRFEHVLPADQDFQGAGRRVIALSRDGRRVVYNTARGLYLRSMDSLEARAISGPGELVVNPFFSPDGESVGYFLRSGALQRISIGGGAAIPICAAVAPFGVSWEPDNTILFGQTTGIMRVPASGGTPELVIAARAGEQVDGPQLLPDGDSVLFSVTMANAGIRRWDLAQIVVQSISRGERKVLLSGGSDARYVPTGHLVYALGDALLAVPFDVSRLEVGGGSVSVVQGVTRSGNPSLTTATAHYGISDGGTLVYARGGLLGRPAGPLSTLVWVDRKGREEPLGAEPKRYVYPRLSPDGMRVALEVREEEQDIWVWDVRRKTMSRLTVDPQLDALPVWTPDGKRLVWTSQRAGPLNLYWQAADGTGPVDRLTESPALQRPSAFTPDGQRLMLSEDRLGRGPVTQDLGVSRSMAMDAWCGC